MFSRREGLSEAGGRFGERTLAVVRVVGALVAADGSLFHAQLLVRVALPHRAPEARVVRPQLQRIVQSAIRLPTHTRCQGSFTHTAGITPDTASMPS